MTGNTLYPLNILNEKYPDIYTEHVRKYEDREKIMDIVIPRINCLWNDALHSSAIHPQMVKGAIAQAGGRSDYTMRCYQIDPYILDPNKAVVYLYSTPNTLMSPEDEFKEFKPDEIGKYYIESYNNKKKPLPFHLVPHILYNGLIDIKNLPILEV